MNLWWGWHDMKRKMVCATHYMKREKALITTRMALVNSMWKPSAFTTIWLTGHDRIGRRYESQIFAFILF
jgi:hypothetical protein